MHDHGHAQTRCAISAVAEVLVIFKTKIFYRLPVPVITLFKIIRGHWYQSKARIYATDFLLVINTNLRVYPISHRFQVIADYWWNLRFRHTRSGWIPKLTTTIFGYVRLSVSESFAGMHGRILTKLYVITHVHIILFVCVLIYLYRPSCMCDCMCTYVSVFFDTMVWWKKIKWIYYQVRMTKMTFSRSSGQSLGWGQAATNMEILWTR